MGIQIHTAAEFDSRAFVGHTAGAVTLSVNVDVCECGGVECLACGSRKGNIQIDVGISDVNLDFVAVGYGNAEIVVIARLGDFDPFFGALSALLHTVDFGTVDARTYINWILGCEIDAVFSLDTGLWREVIHVVGGHGLEIAITLDVEFLGLINSDLELGSAARFLVVGAYRIVVIAIFHAVFSNIREDGTGLQVFIVGAVLIAEAFESISFSGKNLNIFILCHIGDNKGLDTADIGSLNLSVEILDHNKFGVSLDIESLRRAFCRGYFYDSTIAEIAPVSLPAIDIGSREFLFAGDFHR